VNSPLLQSVLIDDFRNLRKTVEDMGLFTPLPIFYIFHMLHIILLYAAGIALLQSYGTGWTNYLAAALLFMTAQVGICSTTTSSSFLLFDAFILLARFVED